MLRDQLPHQPSTELSARSSWLKIAILIAVLGGLFFGYKEWSELNGKSTGGAPIVLIDGHRCQVIAEFRKQTYMAFSVKMVQTNCEDGVAREATVEEDYDKSPEQKNAIAAKKAASEAAAATAARVQAAALVARTIKLPAVPTPRYTNEADGYQSIQGRLGFDRDENGGTQTLYLDYASQHVIIRHVEDIPAEQLNKLLSWENSQVEVQGSFGRYREGGGESFFRFSQNALVSVIKQE